MKIKNKANIIIFFIGLHISFQSSSEEKSIYQKTKGDCSPAIVAKGDVKLALSCGISKDDFLKLKRDFLSETYKKAVTDSEQDYKLASLGKKVDENSKTAIDLHVEAFRKSLKIAEELKPKQNQFEEEANTAGKQGNLEFLNKNYKAAEQQTRKALDIYRQLKVLNIGYAFREALTLNMLGFIALNDNRISAAESLFEEATRLESLRNDLNQIKLPMAIANENLGSILFRDPSQKSRAEIYYDKAFDLYIDYEKSGDLAGTSSQELLFEAAVIEIKLAALIGGNPNRKEEAISKLEDALHLLNSIKDTASDEYKEKIAGVEQVINDALKSRN